MELSIFYATSVARELRDFLKKRDIDMCVCGSLSLEQHGINLNRPIHDLDIQVVLDTEEKKEFINILAEATKSKSVYDKEDADMKTFDFFGVEVNAFIVKNIPYGCLMDKSNLKYSPVNETIKAKQKYGRGKDMIDFMEIIHFLTQPKPEEEGKDLPF